MRVSLILLLDYFLGKLSSNSFLPSLNNYCNTSPSVSLETRIIPPYCLLWDLLTVQIGQDHLQLAGVSSQSSPSNFGKRFKGISHSTYNKPDFQDIHGTKDWVSGYIVSQTRK